MKILVTGSSGFVGRNLCVQLSRHAGVALLRFDLQNTPKELETALATCDAICHLAGVNRPKDAAEFETGNAGFTGEMCARLRTLGRRPAIVMASSTQAALGNPYGVSKRHAEEALAALARDTGTAVAVFRLKNVFGKWCRPNYNSVVATFCHNIAHDLPIEISDPQREVELIYVDDVVAAMLSRLEALRAGDVSGIDPETSVVADDGIPAYRLTLGDLAGRIQFFRDMQSSLMTPDFAVPLNRQLYSAYLSYVEPERWEYGLTIRPDERGSLAEFIKSPHFGQIFVSRTRPGGTRGNHYHHSKTEKFLVLEGEGLMRFRHIERSERIEIRVSGDAYRVVDIPPGYTHSITNVGTTEMVTLFWASEVFNPDRADTCYCPVQQEPVA